MTIPMMKEKCAYKVCVYTKYVYKVCVYTKSRGALPKETGLRDSSNNLSCKNLVIF